MIDVRNEVNENRRDIRSCGKRSGCYTPVGSRLAGFVMRRNAFSVVLFLCAAVAIVGCTDSRFKHYYKPKEECVLPPAEGSDPRFDKPPSAEYRARVKATEDKSTLMNASKMGSGAGAGRGGF